MKYFWIVISVFMISSCHKSSMNEKTAEKLFSVFNESKNVQEIDPLLADNFNYYDVVLKQNFATKAEYINTLDFNDSLFEYSSEKVIEIESIASSNDSIVWVKGYYNPYKYNGNEIAERKFVSVLYFDKNGKIKHQEEWQDYPFETIINVYQFRNSNLQSGE